MLIVALLMAMTIMAQKTAVSGTVVDASTGEPVMGASVTADGLSVVTNADGFFTLKSEQATEAVVVTHVGYRTRRVVPGQDWGATAWLSARAAGCSVRSRATPSA